MLESARHSNRSGAELASPQVELAPAGAAQVSTPEPNAETHWKTNSWGTVVAAGRTFDNRPLELRRAAGTEKRRLSEAVADANWIVGSRMPAAAFANQRAPPVIGPSDQAVVMPRPKQPGGHPAREPREEARAEANQHSDHETADHRAFPPFLLKTRADAPHRPHERETRPNAEKGQPTLIIEHSGLEHWRIGPWFTSARPRFTSRARAVRHHLIMSRRPASEWRPGRSRNLTR